MVVSKCCQTRHESRLSSSTIIIITAAPPLNKNLSEVTAVKCQCRLQHPGINTWKNGANGAQPAGGSCALLFGAQAAKCRSPSILQQWGRTTLPAQPVSYRSSLPVLRCQIQCDPSAYMLARPVLARPGADRFAMPPILLTIPPLEAAHDGTPAKSQYQPRRRQP